MDAAGARQGNDYTHSTAEAVASNAPAARGSSPATGLRAAAVGLLLGAALLAPATASATTFTVTTTADSGAGSLRQGIIDSNAGGPGPNLINFNIPGSGTHTISPLSALPAITVPVTINGYTQSGASVNTGAFGSADNAVIEILLDGGSAGAGVDGLSVQTNQFTLIYGLNIRNFSGNGIVLAGAGGTTVAGCFIGTDEVGSSAAGNGADGIIVKSANNIIGGSSADARNIISGNGQSNVFAGVEITGASALGNQVAGNYIGTSASGTVAIGNSVKFGYGVIIGQGASTNTIGSSTGPGNVISGNGGALTIQGQPSTSTSNVLVGNRIGTNSAGTAALANAYGIGDVAEANGTVIGGTTAGARNVISGNGNWGILIGGSSSRSSLVEGNFIGTDITGTAAVPNTGPGILYEDAGAGNVVTIGGTAAGAANVIAFNSGAGVTIKPGLFGDPLGDAVLGNSIHDNGGLGIDLNGDGVTPNGSGPSGPNHYQNYPVLSSATTGPGFTHIVGTLASAASTTYRVELFDNASCDASGHGEGQTFLGFANVATDGSGNGAIDVVFPAPVTLGDSITSTATDPANDTSEFSGCVTAATGTLASTTTLVSSLNPSLFSQSVTFTATVTGAGPTPTGSVSFYDGVTLLGPVALGVGGQATLTTSALTVGTHQITAQYGGDGNYTGSTSSALEQVVNAGKVPALGGGGLALMAALLALSGVVALRRALAA